MDDSPSYIAIDLKSYFSSVECVHRGLDPLTANLLVADESRSDNTICLAVSPALKAMGVPSRPRLFEAKEAIQQYEARMHKKVSYIIATPRMAAYEHISAQIYSIYLRYVSTDDIHVYSVDECFIDATPYVNLYGNARELAMKMIQDVIRETGITATVGLGTNLYLAKVAMDVLAKKADPDEFGVRIAELNEDSYKHLLWDHTPITAFWQLGHGKATTLTKGGIFTMGDVARVSITDPEWLYRKFGKDAEILIDHAWGKESVTMADIKAYKPESHSMSVGQVLSRPYNFKEARLALSEMIDQLTLQMVEKKVKAEEYSFWVGYDPVSLEKVPGYTGPLSYDYYGRLHPRHTGGVVRMRAQTSSTRSVSEALLLAFSMRVDPRLYIRRLGIAADKLREDYVQLDMFTDYDALEREEHLQETLLAIRKKYKSNIILQGKNYLEGATARERNEQIGGHKA